MRLVALFFNESLNAVKSISLLFWWIVPFTGCASTLGKFASYLLAEKGVEACSKPVKGLSNRGFRVLHSRSKGVPFHGCGAIGVGIIGLGGG